MKRFASVLDYPHPGLDETVWDESGKLKEQNKALILDTLFKHLKESNLSAYEQWIKEINFVGGLTTYQYTSKSDGDIHIKVDLPTLIKLEKLDFTEEQAHTFLDKLRKLWDAEKLKLPGTNHPIEYFFETPFVNKKEDKETGIYSLLRDEWTKPPIAVAQDFDLEEMKPFLIDMASVLAGEMDASFGTIKRHIQRIEELREVMQAWPKEKRKIFQDKIQGKLDEIEAEIEDLTALKDKVVEDRKDYNKQSPQEVKFKYLQRFGYLWIIKELSEVVDVLEGEEIALEHIPEIKEVINTPVEKQAGQVIRLTTYKNEEFRVFKDPSPDQAVSLWKQSREKTLRYLMDEIGIFMWDAYYGEHYEVAEAMGINPKTVNRYGYISNEKEARKWGSAAELVAKQAQEEVSQRLYIDFDRTIASEKGHEIGEPLPGVKEAFDKFKTDGWEIHIYSCRANDPEGLDSIQKFMSTHDLPFDEIFVGKPLGHYYIDDRALKFTTWGEIAPQVKKQASLVIRAELSGKLWVDPYGRQFKVIDSHAKWIDEYAEKLHKDYDISTFAQDPNTTLVEAGWARITTDFESSEAQFGIEVKDLHALPRYIDHLMTEWYSESMGELGIPVVFNDLSGNIVSVERPFPAQRNVNRALLSSSKTAGMFDFYTSERDAYWLDPKGLKFPVRTGRDKDNTHVEWVHQNLPFLEKEYGIKLDPSDIENMNNNKYDYHKIIPILLEQGWVRVDGGSIQLNNLRSIPDFVFNNLPKVKTITFEDANRDQSVDVDYDEAATGGQKTVNRTLTLPVHASKEGIKYSSVQINIPALVAQDVVAWGVRNIPDEDLFLDEERKSGRELESHITIKYGLLTNESKDVAKFFKGISPVEIKLGKTKHFEPPELPFDVVTIEVISDVLPELNKKICGELECADGLIEEYRPHITVAYVKRGTGKKYIGDSFIEGSELTLDEVVFSPVEGERTTFNLGSEKEAAFMPSIVQAPDNPWQSDSDVEIPVDPDSTNEEQTYNNPAADKPRKSLWDKFLDFFRNKKKIKADLTDKAFWVDPSGVFYEVRNPQNRHTTHASWITQNIQMLIDKYNVNCFGRPLKDQADAKLSDSYILYNVFDGMIQDGWIRIGDSWIGGDQNYSIELKDIRRIPSYIEDWIAQNFVQGQSIQVTEGKGKALVTLEDIAPSLQKAVNQALRNKDLVHARLSKRDIKALAPPIPPQTNKQQMKPLGLTEIFYFQSVAPQEVQDEVDYLLDTGHTSEAWVIMEKYIGRRHLNPKGQSLICPDCGKYHEITQKCDNTTWDDKNQDMEPFKPLPVTYSPETNEENLGQPGVRRFMGRPQGVEYSNDEKIIDFLLEEKRNKKKASPLSDILKLVKETGGATYNLSKGNLSGTKTFAVATHPDRSVILDHAPTETELAQYVEKNQDILNDETSLGVWSSDGKVYLDIVSTLEDKEKAIELGKKNNQIAIFDLHTLQEIPTGGTGEVPVAGAQSLPIVKQFALYIGGRLATRTMTQDEAMRILREKFYEYFLKGDFAIKKEDYKTFSSKKASSNILEIDLGASNLPVFVNPPRNQVVALIRKFPAGLRVIDGLNAMYVWESFKATHDFVLSYLVENGFEEYSNVQTGYIDDASDVDEFTWKSASIKKASLPTRFWIAPDGTRYDAGTHHGAWIKVNKELLVKKYGIHFTSIGTTWTDMMNKGWVRVSNEPAGSGFHIQVLDMTRIPRFVDDLIAEYYDRGGVIGLGDQQGRHVEISDPFPSLQKVVNRYLQKSDLKGKVAGNLSTTYTDQQMEQIYQEQHEYSDSGGGGNVYHDFSNSSTDYPKEPGPYKIRLDLLNNPATRQFPLDLPSYEVTWFTGMPQG